MSLAELSPQVFTILSALIEDKIGLHYRPADRELLAEKIAPRVAEAGFDSLLDYYYYLRYDPAAEEEFAALTEALVIGETYLFREYAALAVVVEAFIQPWCAAGRRPRIWSAACATGEEPLSLAMMLDDQGLLDKVELIASDISARALARARRGRFGRRAVRQLPAPGLSAKYLRAAPDGWAVDSRLIEAVHWRRVNLTDAGQVAALGMFDVILCRNVLIYFREETVRAVVHRLSERLVSDGVLLVGVSESLLRFSSNLVGEERRGAFVYRKASR